MTQGGWGRSQFRGWVAGQWGPGTPDQARPPASRSHSAVCASHSPLPFLTAFQTLPTCPAQSQLWAPSSRKRPAPGLPRFSSSGLAHTGCAVLPPCSCWPWLDPPQPCATSLDNPALAMEAAPSSSRCAFIACVPGWGTAPEPQGGIASVADQGSWPVQGWRDVTRHWSLGSSWGQHRVLSSRLRPGSLVTWEEGHKAVGRLSEMLAEPASRRPSPELWNRR